MVRALILAAGSLVALSVAHAADLEGVTMPDTRVVDGAQMRVNGIGLRTFLVLGIRIYVAGLYLKRPNGDPETILHSPERKLLDIPCYLDPHDVQRFLAPVPSVHKSDGSTLLFTSRSVHITFNGRLMGDIADPRFAELMLATFIGREPPTPRLKRELLGFRD